MRRERLHESDCIDGIGFPPTIQIDGGAIGRIHPTAIDEDCGVFAVAKERSENVYAWRSVAPAQREDDFIPVIVIAPQVNSAEMRG